MEFASGAFVVLLVDESPYNPSAEGIGGTYEHEYDFTANLRVSSRHGVRCRESNGAEHSYLLHAGRGASGVHEKSVAIVGRRCFVAVGVMICSLSLPKLELEWATKVDWATCFGVYHSAEHDCLLSHGELEIARVSLSGAIVWSGGGRDIFWEGFHVSKNWVEAIDFSGSAYRFDIATGHCEVVSVVE